MPIAAHRIALYLTGTSTAFTGESASLVSGTTYAIDDAAKEIWDPDVALVFRDGGTPVSGTPNRLAGTVTLDVAPGGAVTIDGAYLPRVEVGCATSFSLNFTRKDLSKTCFSLTEDAMRRFMGLRDATATLQHIELFDVFGTSSIFEILNGDKATGTITTVAQANFVDGETVTLHDGETSYIFEFDPAGDGVSGSNVQVDISLDTSADNVRDTLIAAINGSDFQGQASSGGAALVNVELNSGPFNTTITETVADAGFLVSGFSGGTEENLKVLEIQMGTTPDQRIRMFVYMSEFNDEGDVEERIEEELSFVLGHEDGYYFEV